LASAAPHAPGSDRTRVLVVDDHSDTVEMMRILLERRGFEVKVAGGIADARRAILADPPDVVVSDLRLGDGSGLELRDLKQRGAPHLVAVTGYAAERDSQEALEAGFDRYLTKPVDVDELATVIRELLEPRVG
jgi:DNA-binding response OmpR family regulator